MIINWRCKETWNGYFYPSTLANERPMKSWSQLVANGSRWNKNSGNYRTSPVPLAKCGRATRYSQKRFNYLHFVVSSPRILSLSLQRTFIVPGYCTRNSARDKRIVAVKQRLHYIPSWGKQWLAFNTEIFRGLLIGRSPFHPRHRRYFRIPSNFGSG